MKIDKKYFGLGLMIFVLIAMWVYWVTRGLITIELNTDLGRDLTEMSNLWLRHVVWLGPTLSAGFPISPIYYYFFFPALLVSGGNPNSLIVLNSIFTLVALAFFGLKAFRRWGYMAILAVMSIGLSPWWIVAATHVGNGFSYIWWLFIAICGLWFEIPFWISCLFFGIAVAFHPVALFALPIFGYEIFKRRHFLKDIGILSVFLFLPWIPIVFFILITRGYYLKNWFSYTGATFHYSLGSGNFQTLFDLVGVSGVLSIAVYIVALLLAKRKLKIWLLLALLPMVFLAVSSQLQIHHLLGITCLVFLVSVFELVETSWGRLILGVLSAIFFVTIINTPLQSAVRSISRIQTVVNTLEFSDKLDKKNNIAVLSILGSDASVPAADDYRFFLRMRGYKALGIQEYDSADLLILFVEDPQFDWMNWQNFQVNRFGSRKIVFEENIEGVKVIGFQKSPQ